MIKITSGMHRSTTDMWATPQWLFDRLDAKYHFDLDVCAAAENAKCEKFYTPDMDGLAQEWTGVCWCNPPYGRELGKWIRKAYESVQRGGCIVVLLLPARTDAPWFHEYLYGKAEIEFLRGRLRFGEARNPAPFPSMICVLR